MNLNFAIHDKNHNAIKYTATSMKKTKTMPRFSTCDVVLNPNPYILLLMLPKFSLSFKFMDIFDVRKLTSTRLKEAIV